MLPTCRHPKQHTQPDESKIAEFQTIDDSVKITYDQDYTPVYKAEKELDTSILQKYEANEFVPTRRVFWKVLVDFLRLRDRGTRRKLR